MLEVKQWYSSDLLWSLAYLVLILVADMCLLISMQFAGIYTSNGCRVCTIKFQTNLNSKGVPLSSCEDALFSFWNDEFLIV